MLVSFILKTRVYTLYHWKNKLKQKVSSTVVYFLRKKKFISTASFWGSVTASLLSDLNIVKWSLELLGSLHHLFLGEKYIWSTTWWFHICWWPHPVQIPLFCKLVKLIPQHLHKAKLKTFTLYDISITKHTRVSRIFKKSYPPIYAPFSQSTPPRFNALVCAGFTIHKTVFFTLEKTLDSSNINIFSPIIGPYQPGSSTNLSNTVWATIKGSLFEGPTSSHIIRLLYPSMPPCIQKPNGFSLSYPSMCHK